MNKNLIILLLFATTIGSAQYGYRDSNMIGITLGLNQFNVTTSDFKTTPGQGWNLGLSMRGNFYNNWLSFVYYYPIAFYIYSINKSKK
jgi:hypothetical protein